MTPEQCRAARAMLDWTQPRLADAAGLGLSTVVDFERIRREVSDQAITAICVALEKAGIEFTNGNQPGVKLRSRRPIAGPAASIPVEDLNAENDE